MNNMNKREVNWDPCGTTEVTIQLFGTKYNTFTAYVRELI